MLSTMMSAPLLVSSLIRHADRQHPNVEVVSRRVEGDLHRTTYREVHARSRRLADALRRAGVRPGDRVATLAWNGYRHLELYFAVSGMGAVLHTLNPRLHPDTLAWIVNHAEDTRLFFDVSFLPLVAAIADRVPSVRAFVALVDADRMPTEGALPRDLENYEAFLATGEPGFDWPLLDENAASSLCYTSGTTGDPKGVLYSHRSTLLHTFAIPLPDGLGLSARDAILPVVPMFHVNAWGLPYAAPMIGAKLVFPGPRLDGASLHELFEAERVTFAAGVPTVWQGLLAHVDAAGLRFSTLRRTVIGGSACPPSMIRRFREAYDVEVLHAWGMTETSPVGTTGALLPKHDDLDPEARLRVQAKQGRAVFGVELRIVDDEGRELPWDGVAAGELQVRGPWVTAGYFRREGISPLQDGWFPTGDVATIDPDGYMQITDRTKDLIKSGGEWVSSIDLEAIALAHPEVATAACIAMTCPVWGERPLLVVVPKGGAAPTRDGVLEHFAGKVAKWQVPDDVVFVDALPIGPTGKVLKAKLRERFAGHVSPRAAAAKT